MNESQRIAFLLAQIASMYAELEAMKASNMERRGRGLPETYGSNEFWELPGRFGLTHNQAISFLLGDR